MDWPTLRHGAIIEMDTVGNEHLKDVEPHGHEGVENTPPQRRAIQRKFYVSFRVGLRIARGRTRGGGEEEEECKV